MAGESQRRTIPQLNVSDTQRFRAWQGLAAPNSPDEAFRPGTDRGCACARAGVNMVGIDPRNECLTSS
ncbi:conserved hypothetical protein [Mesorhizobium escarrei]|uniref:Uncharacterized protein n=1 Tax=Mesorhizobium escarrei TaxID=666018 RepID=A0ABM9EIT7_9HYPH|nr:conserved hypothetical protein [Mesorhizobium escarrei]